MKTPNTVTQLRNIKKRYQADGPRCRERRILKSRAYALFKRSPRFRFGKPRIVQAADILDISTNGLRVQYSSLNKGSTQFDHLSIIDAYEKPVVEDIYSKRISDCQVNHPLDGNYVRVCGVKFIKLSDTQKYRLRKFIQTNTVNPKDITRWHVEFA